MNTPAPHEPPAGGLSTVAQVEELAEQLTACANTLHQRIVREVRRYKGQPVPDTVQEQLRLLLDDEQVLRQRANGLYADAASLRVRGLAAPQQHLAALTADAAEKIRTITRIGDALGLVARLVQVGAAAASAQPAAILKSLEALHHQLDAIAQHDPPPASGA